MKYIDSIVDFIFDKVIQSNKIEVLQLPKEEQNFMDTLRSSLMDNSLLNTTQGGSILRNSPEKKKFNLKFLKNKKSSKSNLLNATDLEKSKESNFNSSDTPKFIPDGEVSIIRKPDNIDEEEAKEQDLSSIVKSLRKKYDASMQSKKGGTRKTLKEIILKKTQNHGSVDYSGMK